MKMFVADEVGPTGVVDRVCEALGYDVVEVGVDVGLEREHVRGSELVFGGDGFGREFLPDALVAIGRAPVESQGIGVVIGCDAVVGSGQDAIGRIDDLGELVVGDGADPVLRDVESIGGGGGGGGGGQHPPAPRGAAA